MIPFLVIALVMLTIACAWVLVPLLSRRRDDGLDGDAANLAVLREQRAELQADLANGVLSAEQFAAARVELDRRVLDETDGGRLHRASPSRSNAWTAGLVGAIMPIGAIVLYLVLGTPAALIPGVAQLAQEGVPKDGASAQDIDTLIERVKERLAARPDDLEGWKVLARTYYALGRGSDAETAFARASALAPNDADLLADYADAVAITQNRSLEGRPESLIARALAIDPRQWKANALAGSLAFTRTQYGKAVEHWERVQAAVPPGSPVAQSITASLSEARSLVQSKRPVADTSTAKIAGTVSLAPALSANVTPSDTVFVFARPADGSRMPLALLRVTVRDLPLRFTLDDSSAMLPNRKLSDHAEVIVGARVSKSGNAAPQPGDLEALAPAVKVGSSGVVLVIDRKLP